MIKKCVICGREFSSPPSTKTVTCSPACRSERARRAASRKRPEEVKAKMSAAAKGRDMSKLGGTEAAKKSALAGRFVTNSSAKSYTLVSPAGEKIDVTNLRHWARNNAELFGYEPTYENVSRICSGFYTIARNIRLNRRGKKYKGWTIIVKDRRKNCEKK